MSARLGRSWRHGVVAGLWLATAVLVSGNQQRHAPDGGTLAPATAAKPQIGSWGFDLTGMDRSARPGDDFYRFAVGNHVDRLEIPGDLPMLNSMVALGLKADEDVRRVVERAADSKPARGSVEQKVADAYRSYLDTARINELGMKPFEADLVMLQGLRTHEDVAAAIGRPGLPANTPIGAVPTVDAKDPNRYTMAVVQAGLGLPNRDFYLSADPAFVQIRTRYREYIEQMLALAGIDGANASAAAIAEVESEIARLHWPLEQSRNKDLTYNPKSRSELQAFAPGFPWAAMLESMGLRNHDRFVVRQAGAIEGLARLFRATPVATWRAYLTFHYLHSQADIMPSAFDEANFAFVGTVLEGRTRQPERWKRAVAEINGPYGVGPLGDGVGRLYVREHFTPEAKAAIRALVDNLLAAYQQRIQSLDWMSPETKEVAIRKAQTVRIKIGYPDRWRDYSALTIEPGDAYGNRRRASVFESNRQLARLDGPTDKDEWSQGPQIVNAYYTAEFNEIGFPAAILQAPLFDPHADAAVNYGGIGGVIGHEMGHGYDDQGAKSDENGVLRTWWRREDEVRFAALTKTLAAQYSAYSPLPGLRVNGAATSGENIGDLGGLSVALAAYEASLGGRPAPVIDGFTGTQRFFLSWAQVWRGKYREAFLRQVTTSDVHSPDMYRVNGVVRNIDAWYEAFGVRPGDPLWLDERQRVRIW